jgi:uncharacterized membrane protein
MKQSRLDALADGIFAIVMTILVFDIKVPHLEVPTESALIASLHSIYPLFLSYLLSFSLLFTYWRAHHFIVSVYAKGVDLKLTNINALFFFFVALVPFSSNFLGAYSSFQTGVVVFATNVILIGTTLYYMRRYVDESVTLGHQEITRTEENHAYLRILFPVFSAYGAIFLSFISTSLALVFLTIGIIYNLLPSSTSFTNRIAEKITNRK